MNGAPGPNKNSSIPVRLAESEDIDAIREIDHIAGTRFAEIGMADVASMEPPSPAALLEYVNARRAWVAEVEGRPVGFAIATLLDGDGHLHELAVHPACGRRGIGRALIERVVDWARADGRPALTLLTFRDVPWNGPYYAKLGFQIVPDEHLTPELRTQRLREGELGLTVEARQAMRLDLHR